MDCQRLDVPHSAELTAASSCRMGISFMTGRFARDPLCVLSMANFMTYVDRQLLGALGFFIRGELELTDHSDD